MMLCATTCNETTTCRWRPHAIEAGAVEFLMAPLADDALLSAIERAIERSRSALDRRVTPQRAPPRPWRGAVFSRRPRRPMSSAMGMRPIFPARSARRLVAVLLGALLASGIPSLSADAQVCGVLPNGQVVFGNDTNQCTTFVPLAQQGPPATTGPIGPLTTPVGPVTTPMGPVTTQTGPFTTGSTGPFTTGPIAPVTPPLSRRR